MGREGPGAGPWGMGLGPRAAVGDLCVGAVGFGPGRGTTGDQLGCAPWSYQ